MIKPAKRLFAKTNYTRKGALTLVPFGPVVSYKTGVNPPTLRAPLPIAKKDKDMQLFVVGRTDTQPDSKDPYVVPYWYVNTTSDMTHVNMESSKISCDAGHLVVYRNTKAIQAGDELLLFKPTQANVPISYKRKAVEDVAASTGSAGGRGGKRGK